MAKDNLQLIIGTVPTGYDTDAIKQTAKAMADAIDKYILTSSELKIDNFKVIHPECSGNCSGFDKTATVVIEAQISASSTPSAAPIYYQTTITNAPLQ